VLIRTSQNPLTMINAVRQQIWATDPAVASTINRSFEDFLNDISYSRPRFTLVILSIFAGLGLVLAAIGVYGVIAYTTERQTHEIGIRMALGADRPSVLSYVIAMGLRLIAIGTAAGLLAAIVLSQFIRSQLVQVSPYDPLTLGAVVVVLLVTGVAASWIPAHRATRVDPAIALRYE
jgi:putative ABC transport system permease protein